MKESKETSEEAKVSNVGGASSSSSVPEDHNVKPKSAEDKQFEENVKFLYRSHQREPGKRRVRSIHISLSDFCGNMSVT